MKSEKVGVFVLLFCLLQCLTGCGAQNNTGVSLDTQIEQAVSGTNLQTEQEENAVSMSDTTETGGLYTLDSKIEDVMADPVFGAYGRLLFPVQSGYYSGDTLGELHLTWYTHINPDETVAIVNTLKEQAKRFFTTSIQMRKKLPTRIKRIQGCFSSKAARARPSPFAMRAEVLPM